MATAFISDLHLSVKDPKITDRFNQYIEHDLQNIDALYILGDLFEYWIGDDGAEILGMDKVLEALKSLSLSGINGYFIAGNRDFLVGDTFSKKTGFEILQDETIITLGNEKVLILHGDSLCTDDVIHQQFREQMMCNPAFHEHALSLSIEERMVIAEKMRGMSDDHKSEISHEIMDVNQNAVIKLLEKKQVTRMIHGHTHRPNIHQHMTSLGEAERIVLGDWYTQSSFLIHDKKGFHLSNLT